MPFYSRNANKVIAYSQFLDGIANLETRSGTLIDQGVVADTYGKKIVWPGTVVAEITGSHLATYKQLVVRTATPSYGPGSDVAVGLLYQPADLTQGKRMVDYVVRGRVREKYVTDVGVTGTVAAATKTALTDRIIWV